jgi:hypothetical protein
MNRVLIMFGMWVHFLEVMKIKQRFVISVQEIHPTNGFWNRV